MKKISAVYLGESKCDECRVFELNEQTNNFEMLKDKEVKYKKERVEEDKDFLVFKIDDDKATLMKDYRRY